MKTKDTSKMSRKYEMYYRTTLSVFVRLPNRRRKLLGKDFITAGYPMAIPDTNNWYDVHDWCRANLRNEFGQLLYTWTGERFWFQTEEVRAKFVAKWGDTEFGIGAAA